VSPVNACVLKICNVWLCNLSTYSGRQSSDDSTTKCASDWVWMPPGPAFGWLCVLHSVTDIAIRAAQIRASQVLPPRPVVSPEFPLRNSKTEESQPRPQLSSDAEATHEPRVSRVFATDPPVKTYTPHLDEQVAPILPVSRSGEQNASEKYSTTTYSPIPILTPPLPDDPNLAIPYAPLSVESPFENVSSLDITLDSVPAPNESQGHKLEKFIPPDHQVRLLILPVSSPLTFILSTY